MRKKAFAAIILAFITAFTSIPAAAALKPLTIRDARRLSVQYSTGLKNTIIQTVKKDIELKQAVDAIRDIRIKESTWRYSLLFKLYAPEQHGLPKEVELVMKVPEILSERRILYRREDYEELRAAVQAELAFYDVLMAEYNVNYYNQRVEDAAKNLASVEKQYNLGEGKKQDVDYMKGKKNAAEKSLQSAKLTAVSTKRKLGNILNTDVSLRYSFTEFLPELIIRRTELSDIMEHALRNDLGLYEATETRRVAQIEVDEMLGIYRSRYGGYINDVQSYINSNRNGQIDYRRFIEKYNYALYLFDSPWYGEYKKRFIFFTIRIPKRWFKGSYSGTRYLEDQKYALFVSLVELDIAKEDEKTARKELEETITESYENLKTIELAYEEAKRNLSIAEEAYNEAFASNQLGLTSFTELESIRDTLYDYQKSLYEMRIDYAKELSSFDLRTSGYLRNRLTGEGEDASDYDAGRSFVEKAEWYINNYTSEYNFVFGIKIPEEYGITEYELCYDGYTVGGKMAVDSEINHLPLTYADNTVMVLRLYSNGKLKYLAYFDGGEYSGELNLIETTESTAGICAVTPVNDFMSRFSITLNPTYDYDTYVLTYNGAEFASAKKGEAIESLNMYFAGTELLEMQLYKGGKAVKAFALEPLEEGDGMSIALVLEK